MFLKNMKINLNQTNLISFKTSNRKLRMNSQGKVVSNSDKRYFNADFHKLLYENTTSFFRYDLKTAHQDVYAPNSFWDGNWIGFRRTIANYFKDVSKVNVYDFACSDGSEAYSLILSLIEELGEETSLKFFPIQAFDIDKTIIKIAQSGVIPCDIDDIRRISENLKNKTKSNYYQISSDPNNALKTSFTASDKLKEKVNFKLSDIQSQIDNINPTNSLVLCRNFWPYLSQSDRQQTFKRLCDKLDETSLIVIGYFDTSAIKLPFEEYGYQEICPFVYKKVPNNSF